VFHVLTWAISAAFSSRAQLIAENLCLRQQLSVLQRRSPQPRLRNADWRFWILREPDVTVASTGAGAPTGPGDHSAGDGISVVVPCLSHFRLSSGG
jgi:hypothetical protein